MVTKNYWKKQLGAVLAGGYLMFSAVAVMAAPLELTLDDSIAMALNNNPSIKVASAEKEKASWTIDEIKSGKQPVLNFTNTSIHLKTAPSPRVPSAITDNFDNQLQLSMPLYTGGKLEGAIDKAKLGYKAADFGLNKTKQQVKLDATTGYFGVLQARNMVKVAQEAVNSLTEHLKNVQAHYEVGTVAKSDVLRSEVELANAQQNLIKAQNAYDLAVSSLNNVIGTPLDTELIVKDELKYNKYSMSLDVSIQYALENRPEISVANIGIDSAKQDIKIAKAGNQPTVGAFAKSGWSDKDFPGTKNNNWALGLKASWDIFDSGVTGAKVKGAGASLDKAEQQAKQASDGVQLEVRSAYLSMKEAEKRIDTTQVAVAKAEEDFKIAQVRYNAGVGTNTDVIDAQVALSQAKTNYYQALYDYNTSKAKLEKAMGVPVQ